MVAEQYQYCWMTQPRKRKNNELNQVSTKRYVFSKKGNQRINQINHTSLFKLKSSVTFRSPSRDMVVKPLRLSLQNLVFA
ncbi:hypothetical protein MtrunA17_Chr4g0043611 [Medicago truncatula]|uniref:Uncharacterized protein n=1 Tax=Medicago truncatula TaxID=3880 RepID=A0A396IBG0_MEDTR|nr:hypothetical protein MtrunA17_Chr4g0043611 [Medicago truncatula]